MRKINIAGQRFGRLMAMRECAERAAGRIHWLCLCDCGNTKAVSGQNLSRGRTQSCGCLRPDIMCLPPGEAAINAIFLTYRKNAERRGHTWELSRSLFSLLLNGNCFYCGSPPDRERLGGKKCGIGILLNGIDRADNREGYTVANSVSCCTDCNKLKGNFPSLDFVSRCILIANKWKGADLEGLVHYPFSTNGRGPHVKQRDQPTKIG